MTSRRAVLVATASAVASPCWAGAARFDAGLLWRVTPRGVAASHLFGTLHIDDARAKDFAAPVTAALKNARLFMPELRSDAESGRVFAAATQLPPDQSLRAIAGEDLFERVARLLAVHYRIPPRASDRLKPWAAFLQLNQPTRPQGETVDALLERLAVEQRKPVEPLESVQEQIDALEAIPAGSQMELLEAQSRHHGEAMAALDRLVALYLAQDLAGLDRHQRALTDDEPALKPALDDLLEQLLYRRSDRMARRLKAPLQAGRVFVAVGALHLHGERGLAALLAAAGYRVERVG
jgi:uncharacterized protein YbaP (TraB family)